MRRPMEHAFTRHPDVPIRPRNEPGRVRAIGLLLVATAIVLPSLAAADDAAQTLRRTLTQKGSAAPWVTPGARALRVIGGVGLAEASENTVDMEWRLSFNDHYEVGWLNEVGEFQRHAQASDSLAIVTLYPKQIVDVAIRDVRDGKVTLASAGERNIVPLDSLGVGEALEPVPAGPYAARWMITWPGAPVLLGIDATQVQGHEMPKGNGLELMRLPPLKSEGPEGDSLRGK